MRDTNTGIIDLLEIAHLQSLQDNFSDLTGVSTSLVDADGQLLTSPSLKTDFLRLLFSTKQGEEHTQQMFRKLCMMNRKNKGPAFQMTPETGVTTGAVPIFLGDNHLASWVICELPDGGMQGGNAKEFLCAMGVAEAEAQAAVDRMQGFKSRKFEDIFPFFEVVTGTLIRLAQMNYEMSESNQNLVEMTEQLESTAQMLSKFTNSANVGMYVADFFTGEILQVNERFAQLVGSDVESLLGRPCWKWYDAERQTFCADCPHDKLLDERGHPSGPYVWERYMEKQQIWGQLTNQAIYWVDGRLAQMVTLADITQTKKMQDQLANLAYYDRGMKLPNSLKLLSDMQQWNKSDSYHLICFDIVALRTINDVYSRHTGDRLLWEIYHWIEKLQDGEWEYYRVDGDEFVLRLKNKSREYAKEMAERILARFDEAWIFDVNGDRLHIFCTVSTGLIHIDSAGGIGGEELLSLMERTLANARETGKVAVYDEEMDQAYKRHLKLQLSLRTCIKEGMRGFEVFYQPIVDPATGKWCSLEALCRWTSPDVGDVPPLVFIQEAEQMGLIGVVGRWVLETAISHCKSLGLDRLDKFLLDVNLSPAQMTDEFLVSSVIDTLEKYDFPGSKLSLEITESVEINFSQFTVNAIDRLRKANVQVALDDFGTGYSSFNNLKKLPVTILKTEKAFLYNIENDSYLQYLFYVMVELAHAADMKIIAEGVENEEQMRILLRNGVDYLQGYLFSRPLSRDELRDQIDNFKQVSDKFYRFKEDKIDMKKLLESGYTITPTLYETLNKCMQTLLAPVNTDQAVEEALKIVGRKFGISRTYMFWKIGERTFSNTHEWCEEGILPQKDALSHVDADDLDASWIPMLEEQGLIIANDVKTLPEDLQTTMCIQDIKSIVVIPIWKDDELNGFVGFDDCKAYREWLPEEVLMLHNLSLLLANVMEKRQLELEVLHRSTSLENVFNSMDILLFVTDLDSREVLFANKKMVDTFGTAEGKPCWQVMHALSQPCEECISAWLFEHPEEPLCEWKHFNRITGRHYDVYDGIITWHDDKQVHLKYAIDVTESWERSKRMQQIIDEATGVSAEK